MSVEVTTVAKRTDIHRPSAIIPDDYQFVAFDNVKIESFGDCFLLDENRQIKAAHMARTGGKYSQHEHGGSCYVCGAGAIWTATFYHAATNAYIKTGLDCADKLGFGYGDFNAFKRSVTNALEAVAGKRKAQAYLTDKGLSRCWDLYIAAGLGIGPSTPYEESTIIDIVGKLVRYGSVSEKTENFLGILLGKIDNRAVAAAQRAAEHEAAEVCPEGRGIITGEILSTRSEESQFGTVIKMLIRDDRGFKVWDSMPGGLDAKRGDRVCFSANVTRSDKDEKFGFYKRPTKAVNLSAVSENLPLAFKAGAC